MRPSEIAEHLLEADPTPDPRELIFQAGDELAASHAQGTLDLISALKAHEFYHKQAVYADGVTPLRARRNGGTKTWKTRPGLFSVPIKIGMYEYGHIDNFSKRNADEWQTIPPVHLKPMPRIKINF